MTDIEIVFLRDNPTPIVTREHQAILEDQRATWEVTSYDPRIESVRIEFAPGTDFFDSPNSLPNEIIEPLHLYGDIRRREVYGRAPTTTGIKSRECRPLKYTVSGLDSAGRVLAELDPDIVIARP